MSRSLGIRESDQVLSGILGRDGKQKEVLVAEWQQALWDPLHPDIEGSDLDAYFQFAADELLRGRRVAVVSDDLSERAYDVLDPSEIALIGRQILSSRVLANSAVRFDDFEELYRFVDGFFGSRIDILMTAAGARGKWQRAPVAEFARGVALTSLLVNLKADSASGKQFVPYDITWQGDDSLQSGKLPPAGEVPERVRQILWRVVVRARDSFAQGASVSGELDPPIRAVYKRWLFLLLEVLVAVENRRFDVWSRSVRISRLAVVRANLQARFGRTGIAKR